MPLCVVLSWYSNHEHQRTTPTIYIWHVLKNDNTVNINVFSEICSVFKTNLSTLVEQC